MLFRHRLAYHSTSLLFVLSLVPHNDCSPPCQTYGCTKSLFLPAPPGHAPSCAKHGETFCEQIEHYPTHVIEYLVERWQFDYNSIFLSERKETKPRPMYGPPSHTYPYPPKTRIPTHYGRPLDQLLPPPSQHYNTFFPPQFNQSDIGYPDRRFPLSPAALQLVSDDPGFIYSAIIHPELAAPSVTPYDTNKWWKRYTRLARKKRAAIETEKHVNGTRVKRQVSDGRTTTLCPTTPRFIMPRAALNSKGNWMYVVNLDTDQRYTQLVRSETCISSQCNGICSLPNGYTSRCEQQFVQKRLVALDGSGDNLYTDIFWLPHCCICQITQVNL
ncbi:Hypothetical protein NTJ_13866 [Nesidiocoris tenuis]|uniref:Spaetzle domain-containing protein n=1 Tax=Nesidiocoris tenuis TaxID=355587 RepID=A0ABN7B9H9_9HEMI|nr:Hypothetical protein NTJ_13866 [Nesidiocoris tenuis]